MEAVANPDSKIKHKIDRPSLLWELYEGLLYSKALAAESKLEHSV